MLQTNENDFIKIGDSYPFQNKKQKIFKIKTIQFNLNNQIINKLDDYTEVIPQKIENKKKSMQFEENNLNLNLTLKNENIEENCNIQNLDFSFGKDFQKNKINETSMNDKVYTLNDDININVGYNISKNDDKKANINYNYSKNEKSFKNNEHIEKREIYSDNYSNHHQAESISSVMDNIDGFKNMKLIKEKFVNGFKNKERSESLEKALEFFDKYSNNSRIFKLNHSFSNINDNHNRSFTKQIMNGIENIAKNKSNYYQNNKKNSFTKLKIAHILKNSSYIPFNKNISNTINNINNNKKIILKKIINRKKGQNKGYTQDKIYSLKNEKKKGFYIRKVVREEKYFIDDSGKEKIIGIKQSIIDSKEKNNYLTEEKNINEISNSVINYKNKNKTLLNKKKFTEYIIKEKNQSKKEKIDDNKVLPLQGKNFPNNFNNRNIGINIDLINNKTIQNDNTNNIKIVINKINKINANPKINLNFVKKYKNSNTNNNIQNNISSSAKINKNFNNINKIEFYNNKAFHLIKVDKFKNETITNEYRQKRINSNLSNYQNSIPYNSNKNNNISIDKISNKIKPKIKDKLRIVKCEKFDGNEGNIKNGKQLQKQILGKNYIYINSNSRAIIQNRHSKIPNKRNYSYKEVRNISNNSKSLVFNSNNDIENDNFRNTKNYLTIDIDSHIGSNYDKYRNTQNEQSSLNTRNNINNHIYYESKSFSSKKKINPTFKYTNAYKENYKKEKELKSNISNRKNNKQFKTLNFDNSRKNKSNRIYFCQYDINNHNIIESKKNDMNIINNNNIYNINTSFNTNIYNYNNGAYNKINFNI